MSNIALKWISKYSTCVLSGVFHLKLLLVYGMVYVNKESKVQKYMYFDQISNFSR